MSDVVRKKLTAKEALQEVYRLTPQIRDIDDLLAPARMRWLPYTMFFQHANYRSKSINTDSLGFRISSAHGRDYKVSDDHGDDAVSLIVGSSTAMGTGATSDAYTLASRLSHHRNEKWLNFGARAYNSTQEVLLFLMHQHRFQRIKRVVLVSGMNNLVLEGLPEEFRSDHGQYYYSYEYIHFMTMYNEEQGRKKQNLLQRLTRAINDEEETILSDEAVDTERRIARSVEATERALWQWKALLRPYGAQVSYVLQPLTVWTKDALTKWEADITHAVDSCPNNFWRLFGKILGKEVHQPYAGALRAACNRLDVPFHDLNTMIRNSDLVNDDVFVDRLHFTDHGHDGVAKLINEQVL